ncbi:MAG: enoyl-CoA hydratase/isomerase family protein [Alphaproteobacteria bacterium]|nr:enoyl-CoA hydratase/isomerase family protein [Alphaproteobacteria bacterium]
MAQPTGDEPEILFDRDDGLGVIRLNRPRALNALTASMIEAMADTLANWATDPDIGAVAILGAGDRAFCAGGDVRALYDARNDGTSTYRADFYRDEYRLNRQIYRFPKPYIALMDGITMGGGVGVSVHGSHRVVTERTLFAMPETGIGLFPDVGGGDFLPQCPGAIGMYLGLAGARLNAADCLYAGIASHYIPWSELERLIDALGPTGDDKGVDEVLDAMAEDPGPSTLAEQRADIDRFFGLGSVADIISALAADAGDWAAKTLVVLGRKSPMSLRVAFRQLREGAAMEFEDVMVMEYRLSQRCMADHDFFEGVRAVIIDKDNAPQWRHASADDVTDDELDAYFAPLGADDLTFD